MSQFAQVVNQPFLYVNGLNLVPATTAVLVNPGQCRDSSNEFDMFLPEAINLDLTASGINGLDTGTLAANQSYSLYVIGDAAGFAKTAVIATLTSGPGIVMPLDPISGNLYNISRRIGYFVTDATPHVRTFLQTGKNSEKFYQYDLIVEVLTGGTSAGYAAVDLFPALPKVVGIVALLSGQTSASSTASCRPTGNTTATNANAAYRLGGTAGVIVPAVEFVTGGNVSLNPSLDYNVSAGNLNLYINGFVDSL